MSHTCGHTAGFLLRVEVVAARRDALRAPWLGRAAPPHPRVPTDTAVNPEQAAACRALGTERGCSCRRWCLQRG